MRLYIAESLTLHEKTGYSAYENILHAGCFTHTIREFEKFWRANKNPISTNAFNQIRSLYKIEEKIRTQDLFLKEMFSEIVPIQQDKENQELEFRNDLMTTPATAATSTTTASTCC